MNFSDLSQEEKRIPEVAQPLGPLSNSLPRIIYLKVTLVKKLRLPNCCENQSFILCFPKPSFRKHIKSQLLLYGLNH